MILQNFKIDDDRKRIIGISEMSMLDFLRQFALSHSTSKMYCMKIVEVNHSQLSRNYLYVVIGEYSKYTGDSVDALEKRLLNSLKCLIESKLDDNYSSELFFDKEVIDKNTGELLESQLKSISKWSNTAMSRFIDLLIVIIGRESPDFIIPDPKLYIHDRIGKKNELLHPNQSINL